MDSIAIAMNDLGEPDAGNPPVRFDEGWETAPLITSPSPAYSTKSVYVLPVAEGVFKAKCAAVFGHHRENCQGEGRSRLRSNGVRREGSKQIWSLLSYKRKTL